MQADTQTIKERQIMAKINSIKEISKGIFDMVLLAPEVASGAKAGQFVNLYLNDASKLLPRPISICGFDAATGTVRLVFRVVGGGTAELSEMSEGDEIKVLGPLGNGFFEIPEKNALLFGGGIGIPPMLGLAKKLHSEGKKVTAILGYRDSDNFLADEFKAFADVIIATDDGSVGFHGNVVDAAKSCFGADESKKPDQNEVNATCSDLHIFACGPLPMLRGVKAFAAEHNAPAQLSMEERMACGVGACLACVCKSSEVDHHSNVKNKRVCKDGPVFMAEDIEL
ncbi:MAG: dihydroorotate dehydrogenase electron transfer subunit [Lachnospiraceae bacterium]|nr:dihydroorotate dehydrogenase electron transfer subunit [Lachnospiraceae bacterium]